MEIVLVSEVELVLRLRVSEYSKYNLATYPYYFMLDFTFPHDFNVANSTFPLNVSKYIVQTH